MLPRSLLFIHACAKRRSIFRCKSVNFFFKRHNNICRRITITIGSMAAMKWACLLIPIDSIQISNASHARFARCQLVSGSLQLNHAIVVNNVTVAPVHIGLMSYAALVGWSLNGSFTTRHRPNDFLFFYARHTCVRSALPWNTRAREVYWRKSHW